MHILKSWQKRISRIGYSRTVEQCLLSGKFLKTVITGEMSRLAPNLSRGLSYHRAHVLPLPYKIWAQAVTE